MLRRIENIRAAAGIDRRARGRGARLHWGGRGSAAFCPELLKAIFAVVLHALELHLKLLVAVLQLLDRTGQLTERIFHAIKAD